MRKRSNQEKSWQMGLRVLLLVVVSSAAIHVALAQKTELTLISYNVLHGFDEKKLQGKFQQWVRAKNPDIVALQEMNGFTQDDLDSLAAGYGHPYAIIMNTEGGLPVTHPLAITSRYPIVNVQKVIDNMWHGYLYANIMGINVFVTHLAPFTLKDRQRDMRKILAHAQLLSKTEKVIIAGDFNALSPVDSVRYGTDLLQSMQRIEGRLEPKSGTPIVRGRTIYRNNLNEGKIDFSVMQMIINAGYKDAYYLTNESFRNSVPTKGHAGESPMLRRIDYVWVSPSMAKEVVSTTIIQDDETASLSDHYPVLVKINVKQK
jgi:exodeoxyribonuclease III